MNNSTDTVSVDLPKQLTITNVKEVKKQLDEALSQNMSLKIDASTLENVDTAGIQLLLAIKEHARNSGIGVAIDHLQSPVTAYGNAIGLHGEMLSCA